MPRRSSAPLEFDELLAAEYQYIAQAANQANEDRARVASFYLVAVGSFVAALLGTQFIESGSFTRAVNLMFAGVFVLLTLLGTSTILQLSRLRKAWHESMLAMNHLKGFAIRQNAALAEAFLWNDDTLPPRYKRSSMSYYQAFEAAMISGLMFGTGAYFFQQAFFVVSVLTWMIAALTGVLVLLLQLQIYKRSLL